MILPLSIICKSRRTDGQKEWKNVERIDQIEKTKHYVNRRNGRHANVKKEKRDNNNCKRGRSK